MNEPPLQSVLLFYIPAQTHNYFKSITDKHSSPPLLLPFCVAASFFASFSSFVTLYAVRWLYHHCLQLFTYFLSSLHTHSLLLLQHRYLPHNYYESFLFLCVSLLNLLS